jgi:hypothetical protein
MPAPPTHLAHLTPLQSTEEVARLIAEARKAATAAAGLGPAAETDDYIEEAMDNYEASLEEEY